MNQSMTRTLAFVATALISTALAFTSNQLTKPATIPGTDEFGKEFNPDFTDAGKARSMRVVSFDEATAASKMFTVQYDGGWKIPSYHNYPADGKDQLAKAAASVIGLKRGSLATRRKTDHERFGVIDPLDEENPATKGRGMRITISEKETALADFIVGNKVEGDEDKRYVRKFGEDKVYRVSARFDVSTKFSDWAETDLLKVTGFDITRLRGSRPKINDADEYEGDDVVELTKDKPSDPWKLAGLDESTEELKSDDINAMVTTLDDLRLVGVRPRPAFDGRPILNANLKVELPKQLLDDPRVRSEVIKVLRADLGEKGFRVGQDDEGQTQIVSREGELTAGTKDGVVYKLTFGSVFSGTEQEIETGAAEEPKADGKEKKKDASKQLDDQRKSRYLIVRVNFDESLLGNPPAEPTKPTPPPGVEPPADPKEDDDKKDPADKKEEAPKKGAEKKDDAEKKDSSDSDKTKTDDEKSSDSKKTSDDPAGAKGEDTVATEKEASKKEEPKDDPKSDKPEEKKPATEKNDDTEKKDPAKKDPEKKVDAAAEKPKDDAADAKKEEAKPDEPKKDLKAEYFEALKRYDAEKGRFTAETAAHAAKIESGKQKVQELNDRFADWYYVISNDSFDKLRLSRAVLIKPKDMPADKDKTEAEKKDGDLPAEKPDADKKPEAEKKEDDKPAEKSKEEPAKEEKKTDKKDEKPADDK